MSFRIVWRDGDNWCRRAEKIWFLRTISIKGNKRYWRWWRSFTVRWRSCLLLLLILILDNFVGFQRGLLLIWCWLPLMLTLCVWVWLWREMLLRRTRESWSCVLVISGLILSVSFLLVRSQKVVLLSHVLRTESWLLSTGIRNDINVLI